MVGFKLLFLNVHLKVSANVVREFSILTRKGELGVKN